jgi:hypothetical protein
MLFPMCQYRTKAGTFAGLVKRYGIPSVVKGEAV